MWRDRFRSAYKFLTEYLANFLLSDMVLAGSVNPFIFQNNLLQSAARIIEGKSETTLFKVCMNVIKSLRDDTVQVCMNVVKSFWSKSPRLVKLCSIAPSEWNPYFKTYNNLLVLLPADFFAVLSGSYSTLHLVLYMYMYVLNVYSEPVELVVVLTTRRRCQ